MCFKSAKRCNSDWKLKLLNQYNLFKKTFFLVVLGLNSGPHACYTGILPIEPLHQQCFVLGISKVSFCELLVWGWLGTLIFLISASKVARIIGVSHQFLDLCECSKIEFIKIHTF
jgi:hypothetical protein